MPFRIGSAVSAWDDDMSENVHAMLSMLSSKRLCVESKGLICDFYAQSNRACFKPARSLEEEDDVSPSMGL